MMLGARTGAWAKSGGGPYGGLCFTAEAANSSVQLTKSGSPPAVTLVKSFDGVNWEDYTVGDVIELPTVGSSVYLAAGEGGNKNFCSSRARNYHKFVIKGFVAASGDITSLLNFDLSQTALASSCYGYMFRDCTGLTSAPELPATTLASSCYSSMFYGCTGISLIKAHFTVWGSQTDAWVSRVASTGTFYKPSALPEEYGMGRIPTGWTVVNIGKTT